jgi:lipoprotein-anchoring transpeptidase ErfK/SrfK
MKNPLTAAALLSAMIPCLTIAQDPKKEQTPEEMEAAVRLQVFLDRAEFGPGKIDGRYGAFTHRALALYREAKGLPPLEHTEPAKTAEGKAKTEAPPPDVRDLDLGGTNAFTDYTITEKDAGLAGTLPQEVEAQAKLKWLPYRTLAEAVAEKFHCDLDFFNELNGGAKDLKAGDVVKVPDVNPFVLEEFKAKAKEDNSEEARNAVEDKENAKDKEDAAPAVSIKVDTRLNMLLFLEGEQLTAAYPVTVGSGQTASPIGEWKVRRAYYMPHFRYDEKMLKEGERSDDFHLLAPGPNNPVGAAWIALNKKGIGLHGTNDPDSIGRAASHGCIRLANWDAVRLAARVQPGMRVVIE